MADLSDHHPYDLLISGSLRRRSREQLRHILIATVFTLAVWVGGTLVIDAAWGDDLQDQPLTANLLAGLLALPFTGVVLVLVLSATIQYMDRRTHRELADLTDMDIGNRLTGAQIYFRELYPRPPDADPDDVRGDLDPGPDIRRNLETLRRLGRLREAAPEPADVFALRAVLNATIGHDTTAGIDLLDPLANVYLPIVARREPELSVDADLATVGARRWLAAVERYAPDRTSALRQLDDQLADLGQRPYAGALHNSSTANHLWAELNGALTVTGSGIRLSIWFNRRDTASESWFDRLRAQMYEFRSFETRRAEDVNGTTTVAHETVSFPRAAARRVLTRIRS
jgi:hypothetical protein